MKTYKGICLKDEVLSDGTNTFTLKRGTEYTISPVDSTGTVTVFSNYWVSVPATLFGGLVPGPGESHEELISETGVTSNEHTLSVKALNALKQAFNDLGDLVKLYDPKDNWELKLTGPETFINYIRQYSQAIELLSQKLSKLIGNELGEGVQKIANIKGFTIIDKNTLAENLAPFYKKHGIAISELCDDFLDRSGALLGYVRNAKGSGYAGH